MGFFDFLNDEALPSLTGKPKTPGIKKPGAVDLSVKTPDFVPNPSDVAGTEFLDTGTGLPPFEVGGEAPRGVRPTPLGPEPSDLGGTGIKGVPLTSNLLPNQPPMDKKQLFQRRRGESVNRILPIADSLLPEIYPIQGEGEGLPDPWVQKRREQVTAALRNHPENAPQIIVDATKQELLGKHIMGREADAALQRLYQSPKFQALTAATKEHRGILGESGEAELQARMGTEQLPSLERKLAVREAYAKRLEDAKSKLQQEIPGAVSDVERKSKLAQLDELNKQLKSANDDKLQAHKEVLAQSHQVRELQSRPDHSMSGQPLDNVFKLATHSATGGVGIGAGQAVGDVLDRVDPKGKLDLGQKAPFAVNLHSILGMLPEASARKFLSSFDEGRAANQGVAVDKEAVKPGLGTTENADLAYKDELRSLHQQLAAASGMDSFGGVMIYVLLSMLVGPKISSAILVDRAKTGELQDDIADLKRQRQAQLQERIAVAKAREQGTQKAAAAQLSDQTWYKHRDYQPEWKIYAETMAEARRTGNDELAKVNHEFGRLSSMIDDLRAEMQMYTQAMPPKEIPPEIAQEYDALVEQRKGVHKLLVSAQAHGQPKQPAEAGNAPR